MNTIENNSAASRFETTVDGVLCVLDYQLANGILTITHTGVPEQVGGRGIASELTRTAFETARSKGWKVVPACSYASAYVTKHPEVADLIA